MTTIGLILAGGMSRRFGPENKLLAPVSNVPLAAHAASAMRAVPLDHRLVVARGADVAALFDGFEILAAPEEVALSASLKTGLARARALGADRLLIALGDMPGIDADVLNRVLALCQGRAASAVTDGTRRMPPACFPAAQFAAMAGMEGDRGAGPLLKQIPEANLLHLPGAALRDVDRPEDLPSAG